MKAIKLILVMFLVLLIISLSFSYITAPLRKINLGSINVPPPDQIITGNQFYPDMRFQDSKISYRIDDECSLSKKNQMEKGFERVEEETFLEFYPVISGEQITITCDEMDLELEALYPNFYIAGEGGPTEIIKTSRFSIIKHGEIILIREARCYKPTVAVHELLHVLGFDHSNNPLDIMYNVTSCDQEISNETIQKLQELYSVPSHADLEIRNVSAYVHSRYLDTNVTVVNQGLADTPAVNLSIYAEDEFVDNFEIKELEPGLGRTLMLKNIYIQKRNFDYLTYSIDTDFEELEKKNNKIRLEVSV